MYLHIFYIVFRYLSVFEQKVFRYLSVFEQKIFRYLSVFKHKIFRYMGCTLIYDLKLQSIYVNFSVYSFEYYFIFKQNIILRIV